MAAFGILLLFLVMGALATLLSRRPAVVHWYRRGMQERSLLPDAVGADGYRGALFQPPIEIVEPVFTDVEQLPVSVRQAAAACRVAFIAGVVAILPTGLGVAVEASTHGPQAAILLGLPGLALAFGQLSARRALFAPSRSSASTALGVGVWIWVHNAAVLVAVALASFGEVPGTWQMFDVRVLGICSLLYVGFSVWIGVLLVRASRVMGREFSLAQV